MCRDQLAPAQNHLRTAQYESHSQRAIKRHPLKVCDAPAAVIHPAPAIRHSGEVRRSPPGAPRRRSELRLHRQAERCAQPIERIHRGNRDREVGQLFRCECRSRRSSSIGFVRCVGLADAGGFLGPGKRCPIGRWERVQDIFPYSSPPVRRIQRMPSASLTITSSSHFCSK